MRRLAWVLIVLMGLGWAAWSQESSGAGEAQSAPSPAASEGSAQAEAATQLQPIFPPENANIVFVEGEDAVSTNFNKEPILNYGASGSRTLQLNRGSGLQDGMAFYSTYVFYLEQPGTYELWYGGTPAGPGDDLLPSYASPFRYRLDESEPVEATAENITVLQEYTPSYYWCRVGKAELAAGAHTLDFRVTQKRGYDGRFLFYLDAFFLVRLQDGRRVTGSPLPAVFPQSLDTPQVEFPFKAIEDYQIRIREQPERLDHYLELARIYTLASDYLGALKYLRRAELLDPQNVQVKLLIAKNRIWKGDVAEGLKKYRELLLLDPERMDLWLEAGKVAAWTGRYEESIAFYRSGLEHFPDQLDLTVNLALAYLWAGQAAQAEQLFQKAAAEAAGSAESVAALARVYQVNGYSDRAAQLLESNLGRYPDRLELYLMLESIRVARGEAARAQEVRERIQRTFAPSPKLARYLDTFRRKQTLKEQVIAGYLEQLKRQPDDLRLRATLAQTYFWNGERQKAIEEYHRILANHAFRSLNEMDQKWQEALELLDVGYLRATILEAAPAESRRLAKELADLQGRYGQARQELERYEQQVQKAREKGQQLPEASGRDDLQRSVDGAAEELALAAGRARDYLATVTDTADSAGADRPRVQELQAADREAQEVFEKVTSPVGWQWDRGGMIQELESHGGVLARYVLGRVALIERRASTAERLFEAPPAGETAPPRYDYGLLESLLWQGKAERVAAMLEEERERLGTVVPYLDALESARADAASEGQAFADMSVLEPGGLDDLQAQLSSLAGQAREALTASSSDRLALHRIVQRAMVRAFFHLEEGTYLLRNELGDYYLSQGDLSAAIRQYRQVLAIDPWDIDAVYRLGKVYERSGDWAQAMKNYKKVFWNDPLYENITGQYNRLAREHADSLSFAANTVADTQRIMVHGETSYKVLLSSLLGLRLRYALDGSRLFAPPAGENPSAHLVHDLSFSAPLELGVLGARLEPTAGLYLVNRLYGEAALAGLTDTIGAAQFLGFGGLEVHAALGLEASLGRYLSLSGQYAWGRKTETFTPGRTPVFAHSGELALNTSLSFIQAWPLRDSASRTYGQVEFLSDGNFLFTAAEELTLRLLTVQEPSVTVHLLGNFLFQDSRREETVLYYTPIGVLVATGGLMADAWLGVGEDSSLNLHLRGVAGAYEERIVTPGQISRLQVEGEASVGLARGQAFTALKGSFSATYAYAGKAPGWDYWSLYVGLEMSADLPRLIAP